MQANIKTPEAETSNQTVGNHDLIDLQLTLSWNSDHGQHQETQYFYNFNVWRDLDLLPFELHNEILGQSLGHIGEAEISPGDAIPMRSSQQIRQAKASDFDRHFRGREVAPHVGRFYPQEIMKNLPGVMPGSVLPLRIAAVDEHTLTCDLNHPLAGYALKVSSCIHGIHGAPDEHGGRCQDAMQEMYHGQGMQVRIDNKPTDFFSGNPFQRMDETADTAFYSMSRMTDHLDATALQVVEQLYAELLPKNARILDLMSSISSHISVQSQPAAVVGLGMNQQELDANSQLSDKLVHDLNSQPQLPFEDQSFDAVVCTVSVEYLTNPIAVFQEVNRILKPGGIFINTFSNRWFPPKAINLWIDLHEYERMGLVSEYFLQSGNFDDVNTWTQQGLLRPDDDKYAGQSAFSDPVYAVWSYKKQ